MEKPRMELLSPAGSMEILKAVSVAGADAVYGAGTKFGARAYANNFTEQELLHAIDYMHLHNKRFYLTVNTLLKEEEIKYQLYDYIKPLFIQGLDGVIIQDIGVLRFLREHFPEMELHASTQMSITGVHGAELMKRLGCNRIVTARELSLEEIKAIHDNVDIEIESFVHGALCYCFSGQCLFSSMLGGRSGNRGRCAQPCRLPYKTVNYKDSYLLSPKDLCTIELLPKLMESGVYSLKIEGRMKQAEYAAGVTGIYREYLDRCLREPLEKYQVSKEDLKRLAELGSRSGFTKGYYLQKNGPDMMTMQKPAHTKSNDMLQEEMRQKYLNTQLQEKIKGKLILSKESPAELMIESKGMQIVVKGDIVQQAKNRPLEKKNIAEKIQKTGGSEFYFEKLEIQMENDIFIPVGALNQMRRDGIQLLQEKLLQKYRRMDDSLLYEENNYCKKEVVNKRKLSVSVQNMEQFHHVLTYPYVDKIYIDSNAFERKDEIIQLKKLVNKAHELEKDIFYIMPVIMRKDTVKWYYEHFCELTETGIDGFVVGNYESLEMVNKYRTDNHVILTDANLYSWSQEAIKAITEAGADEFTYPLEANQKELQKMATKPGELMIYGYLPLMVSAQCVKKNTSGCTKKPGIITMSDRYQKVFSIRNLCKDCYNLIYNSSPLALFHQRDNLKNVLVSGYRISFTLENDKQIKEVMSYYEKSFLREEYIEKNQYLKDFTNGHFKRGVE